MFIGDQAAVDYQNIINAQGKTITLIEPDATEHSIKAIFNRRDMQTDPQTGVKFYSPMTAVTVSLLDLEQIPTTEWTAETTDTLGDVLSSRVSETQIDRTFASVTLILEEVDNG